MKCNEKGREKILVLMLNKLEAQSLIIDNPE